MTLPAHAGGRQLWQSDQDPNGSHLIGQAFNVRTEGKLKGDGSQDIVPSMASILSRAAGYGDGTQAHLLFPAGTYRVGHNYTIPSNVAVVMARGSLFTVDAGATLTISGTFEADASQHFTGSGSVILNGATTQGPWQWWGVRAGVVADQAPAMQRAILGLAHVLVPPGTYYTSGIVAPADRSLVLEGIGASFAPYYPTQPTPIIKALGTIDHVLAIGDDTTHDYSGPWTTSVRNVMIDCNNSAAKGLWIRKGQNGRYDNITVSACADNVFLDGTINASLLVQTLTNIVSINATGWAYRILSPATTPYAFGSFTLIGCMARNNVGSVQVVELDNTFDNGAALGVSIFGGEYDGATGQYGIEVSGSAALHIRGAHVEHSTAPGYSLHAVNGATITVDESGPTPLTDATSRIIYDGALYYGSSHKPLSSERFVVGQQYDDPTWGPPNYGGKPSDKYLPGVSSRDMDHNLWTCAVGGTGSAARFVVRSGTYRKTINASDVANGLLVFFPQQDFVLSRVTVTVTSTLTPGTATRLDLTTVNLGDVISQEQLATRTSGTVLTSALNGHVDALLTGGKIWRMGGHSYDDRLSTPGDYMVLRTDGTWTGGAMLIVVEGFHVSL